MDDLDLIKAKCAGAGFVFAFLAIFLVLFLRWILLEPGGCVL